MLLINKEYARYLVDRRTLAFPLGNGAGHSIFAFASEVGSNAEAGLRTARAEDIFKHLQIAVGSLNEELGLMLGIGTRLEVLEGLGTLAPIDRQIAMEGKTLSIEPRRHDAEDNARGTYQGNHLQLLTLRNGYHIGTGIGHSRTSSLGDHTHGLACLQRLQIRGYSLGRGMLIEFIKGEFVDIDVAVDLLEEATSRTDILYDEMAQCHYDIMIIGRQHLLNGCIAQCAGDKV